ncbi:MAG: 4-hydroxy-tetrahydrodipicolinate reductase [Planctomycetaceae bacterium]
MTFRSLRIAVNGAAGRMGRRIVALAHADEGLTVAAAIEAAGSPHLGQDAGTLAGIGEIGVTVAAELPASIDVVIDFSTPEGLAIVLPICQERGIPIVIATTGFNESQKQEIAAAAKRISIVMAPNMSLAVNVAMELVRGAARALRAAGGGVDVEIIERHHRFKEDAPSGTALKFGEIVAAEMGQTEHVHGRHGRPGARRRQEIGYHALRTGDHVGEHTIVFGLIGETLEVTVRGQTRDSYAYGALAAARFLPGKPPGAYSMADVLGL